MNKKATLLLFYVFYFTNLFAQKSPDELYGPLFEEVQMQYIFEDSKTFVDCIPLHSPEQIMRVYKQQKDLKEFDLKKFILEHFTLPDSHTQNFISDTSVSVTTHIQKLWPILTRSKDTIYNSSLIPLPFPYIVPGGRFREIYYWDSYFTMLGLDDSTMERNMADNFSYLIEKTGFIPNGNRTYYLSRSQPPFYSLMIRYLADQYGDELLGYYLPFMEKEYMFWMAETDSINQDRTAWRRVVEMGNGNILNRYWDDKPTPRPESYREDVKLALQSSRLPEELYREIRAACESGWDFSSRWLKDKENLGSIHTTDIIPVDLNCLLLHLEQTLSEAYAIQGNDKMKENYLEKAQERKAAIIKYCWDRKAEFFMDYDFKTKKPTGVKSLAGAYPLFFEICTNEKASKVKLHLMKYFLKEGGMVTTLDNTQQQWDSPNGWAPLQWIVIKGFLNYGFLQEAANVSQRWTDLNTRIFKNTGKLLEKYNVINSNLVGGGGEYPLQDGFGWTNGVFIKLDGLKRKLIIEK